MFVTGLAAVALAVAVVILRRRTTAQSSPEMAFPTRCNIRKIRERNTLLTTLSTLLSVRCARGSSRISGRWQITRCTHSNAVVGSRNTA